MLLRSYIEVDLPFERAEAILRERPEVWLHQAARHAERLGNQLVAEVGIGPAGPLSKQVRLEVEEPLHFPSRTVFPLHWEPTSLVRLLPRLDADVELAPLGPARTQLVLSGRYRPPLGALGRIADRALMHRVAEATVRAFLERLGRALEAQAAECAPSP